VTTFADMPRILLLLGLLTGCSRELPLGPEPELVYAWARLDESLGHGRRELDYGRADGRAILGDRVLVLNGEEMVRFVRTHGYARAVGITSVRRMHTVTEIDVVIVGRDGARLKLTLQSDGKAQGSG
jgi:hypothetical protein